MRNPIEQLREDVEEAHRYQHSFSGNRIRMTRVFDEFIAEHKVVDGWTNRAGAIFPSGRYALDGVAGYAATTIIVPRKVPTLLAAVKRADVLLGRFECNVALDNQKHGITADEICEARCALAAAIERERGA